MSTSVVVVSGARTPIGSYFGSLADVDAHELGATAVRAALARAGLDASRIDEVIMGCIGQVGPDAYNARRVALAAGIPESSTAFNVNRLCGSGLQAILSGAMQLMAGQSDIIVAGGNESMSRQPFLVAKERNVRRLGDRAMVDGTVSMLTSPFGAEHMGVTADRVAQKFDVSRADQDAWALQSQQRAVSSLEAGLFAAETAPVEVAGAKGATTIVDADEHPRADSTLERLAKLKPAFTPDGTATAGNSSGIADGAAATVLMREDDALKAGLQPLGRLVGWSQAGVDPGLMGYAPVTAIERVLSKLGMSHADLGVVELNEAFAAQVLAVVRDAGLDPETTNPHGGAIALGHPVGATGAILTVKMLYDMQQRDLERGMVTMCIGGGQALAAVFERV